MNRIEKAGPTRDDIVAELVSQLVERRFIDIVEDAAFEHHVTVEELLQSRSASASRARRSVMVVLYVDHHLSLPEVGRLLGRDHTSVMKQLERAGVARRPRPGRARRAAPGEAA